MNRRERDSFTATTDQSDLAYGESACLETPPDLFTALHKEFTFDVDLTANAGNRLLPIYFGPGGTYEDALTARWYQAGVRTRGFSNPPYGAFVKRILTKAVEEWARGFDSVFLLPMRASGWYRDLVLPYADEVRHIDRMKFWYQGQPKPNPKTGKVDTALFDSIIVVYRNPKTLPLFRRRHGPYTPEGCPHMSYWKWQEAKPPRPRAGVPNVT